MYCVWVVSSFLLMFLQATYKGWMDIMYAAVDSRNVSDCLTDTVKGPPVVIVKGPFVVIVKGPPVVIDAWTGC